MIATAPDRPPLHLVCPDPEPPAVVPVPVPILLALLDLAARRPDGRRRLPPSNYRRARGVWGYVLVTATEGNPS